MKYAGGSFVQHYKMLQNQDTNLRTEVMFFNSHWDAKWVQRKDEYEKKKKKNDIKGR